MTEQEWLECEQLAPLLRCLCEQFRMHKRRIWQRKSRLFACGMAKMVWDLIPAGECQEAVTACERLSDSLIDRPQVERLWAEVAQLEQQGHLGCDWSALLKLRKALTADRWGKHACWLSQAANECRRVEDWRLKDAGTSAEVRKAADTVLKRRYLALFHDIFGNPFRSVPVDPTWRTPTAVAIAQGIYDERAFDRLPILADALEDAGCTYVDLLNHCRQPGDHVRGCWALDLLLGKE